MIGGFMYRRHNSLRLKYFDYTQPAVYFITMRVNQHLCLFGSISDKKLKLNAAGKMIANVFTNLPKYYSGVFIDTYIVMPDHFHGIINIDHNVGTPPAHDQLSLGEVVGRFKSYTTTQYISGVKNNQWKLFDKKLWQRGYYDRIVRDKKAYYAIRNYIANNPLHWKK